MPLSTSSNVSAAHIFPICCLSCDARARRRQLFADDCGSGRVSHRPATGVAYVRSRKAKPARMAARALGKVTSIELLGRRGPGYDVCGRDPPSPRSPS